MAVRKTTPPVDPHPRLTADIAQVRELGRLPTFSDEQYRATLRLVAERFPGLELLHLRPYYIASPRRTLLRFIWDTKALVSSGILTRDEVPWAPKRRLYGDGESRINCVNRVRGGRLDVRMEITEEVDGSYPLAMFRPSAVEDSTGPGGSAESWRERLAGCCLKVATLVASTTSVPRENERFHLSAEDAARLSAIGERFKAELLEAIQDARIIDSRRPPLRIVGGTDSAH